MRSSPEFERIEALLASIDAPFPPEVELGPGDDAAVLRVSGGELLVASTDLSVEDVHFRREWLTWEVIGFRAVAAALSDLAAMAARPIGALVSLALPPELDEGVLDQIGGGIGACLRTHAAGLLGGDLSRSPGPVVIDVTVLGAARRPIGRGGAEPGDELWVTGSLGGAAAAAMAWSSGLEPDPGARRRFQHPSPRTRTACWLAERTDLHAAIDLSDGLSADAEHLAAASGVGLEIRADAVPLDPVLDGWRDAEATLALACGGGEDYELLLAVPPGALDAVVASGRTHLEVELTRVGRVVEGTGVRWVDAHGAVRERPAGGFDHFEGGA